MGQILHGCAKTTKAIRRTIQNSQKSIAKLAGELSLNPKTILKWKKRAFQQDAPMGPKEICSTVLSKEEEAIIIAFRKTTLLPLDDCLYALQPTIPRLSRSALHRCLQRHGISRLPQIEEEKRSKRKFNPYPIGYLHIDIAEVHTQEGKLYLIVAVDRVSKFVYAEVHLQTSKTIAAQFLQNLTQTLPYKIHTILTDNGSQFTNRKQDIYAFPHIFDRICDKNQIEHRLTKINHPWTNGQVERMNRTLKEATVKRYTYQNHQQLKEHLYNFLNAYNFAKRLKALKGLTPYECIIKNWHNEPKRFKVNPLHHNMGLNNLEGVSKEIF